MTAATKSTDDLKLYDSLCAQLAAAESAADDGLQVVKEAALSGKTAHDVAMLHRGQEDARQLTVKGLKAALADVRDRVAAGVAAERGRQAPRLPGALPASADALLSAAEAAVERDRRAEREGQERQKAIKRYYEAVDTISAAKSAYVASRPHGVEPWQQEETFSYQGVDDETIEIFKRGNPGRSV
jgi:hypothetical protein